MTPAISLSPLRGRQRTICYSPRPLLPHRGVAAAQDVARLAVTAARRMARAAVRARRPHQYLRLFVLRR